MNFTKLVNLISVSILSIFLKRKNWTKNQLFGNSEQLRLIDISIAKNYLDDEEFKILNNIVSGYFDFAEVQAMRHNPMYMSDYVEHLDNVLKTTDGEINVELHIENNVYHLTMKHDVKECAFVFEIIDWTKGKEREQKRLNVYLKNQGDAGDFIKAFNIFLLSIQYFDYGNLSLY